LATTLAMQTPPGTRPNKALTARFMALVVSLEAFWQHTPQIDGC